VYLYGRNLVYVNIMTMALMQM